MSKLVKTTVLLLMITTFSGVAGAQTTGSVQGTVTDQQDAIVAGAMVELVQVETGVSRDLQTNVAGRYVFEYLLPGTYRLKISAPSFKAATVENIIVGASKTANINVKLEVGAVTEEIVVEASDQPVNVVNAQVSTNVNEKYIRELPSYTRNVLEYAQMQPGVVVNSGQIQGGSQQLNILGTFAVVNGNRAQRNNFYLDGMDNRNYRNEGLQMPNPDAVQEVQVSTSNTAAEYGRQVGGVFNVVTKSGTNNLHGSGFYFFRTRDLNATPWGATENPEQNQKSVGATLGGPIIRNKTFFFASFDYFKDKSAFVINRLEAPTAAMVSGDFSANSEVIYDPDTGLPFPGNVIPPERQDPVGRNLAQLLPTVSTYGDRFIWSDTEPSHNATMLAKVDHNWSDRHSTSFTWMRSSGESTYPAQSGRFISIPAYGPQVNASSQNLYHGRHTWMPANNILADIRIGYTRHNADRDNFNLDAAFADHGDDPMATVGARNTTTPQEGNRLYLPGIGIGNAGGGFGPGLYGHEGWLGLFPQESFHFGGTVSWITGKHSIKLGGDAIRSGHQYAVSGAAPTQTSMNFDGRFSSLGNGQNNFVYGMADLLLGRTTTFRQVGIVDYWTHSWEYFFFLQDEWKISPRVTLSAGLRYEFYMPPTVTDNKRTEYYDPNPVHGSVSTFRSSIFPNAPAGIAFEGDPGVPSGFYETEYNLLAPRFSLAWDVNGDGKTALRAGFGKYFGATALQAKDWPSEQNPWYPSAQCSGYTVASDPWLSCQAETYTAPPTPFTDATRQAFTWPSVVPFMYGFDPNFKTAYNYQWNVFVEREITKSLRFQLGYIGNLGRNLTALKEINWADYTPDANAGNIQARRPNQGFSNISIATSDSKSSYNSLQAVVDVRLSDDLSSRLTYTYQRAYADCTADPTNMNACYANPKDPEGEKAEVAARHVARFFFTLNLPFLKNDDSVLGKVLSGWQLSGDGNITSGTPQNVTLGPDWNYDGVGGDRPDAAGTINYPKTTLPNGNVQWFSPDSGFALPGGGTNHNTFGNLKRNAVFGPGNWVVNAALLKNFRLSKSGTQYLQLRFEAYNLFNHPNLNNPTLSYDSGNFGQITGKTGNRLIQLGMRLNF